MSFAPNYQEIKIVVFSNVCGPKLKHEAGFDAKEMSTVTFKSLGLGLDLHPGVG